MESEKLIDLLKEIDHGISKTNDYLLPWSTGWALVYHRCPLYLPSDFVHYEIICTDKFRVKLFYLANKVWLSRDTRFKPTKYAELPMKINLEVFFNMKPWNGTMIPISLNKDSLEYMVERLFNLVVFS